MPRREYYERHKAELLEKQRLARQKEKEKREVEDPKPLVEKFMPWEPFHEMFPQLTFRDYFERKTQHERPIPRPTAIPRDVEGTDFWHDSSEDREARDERVAGRLLPDVLSDDRPQSSQPQESSRDDLNNILNEHDIRKGKKRDSETID